MAVDRATPLFFDASCVYAAAQSPGGGAARLFTLCRLGWFPGWVSEPVLVEAERNLRRKGSALTLARYALLLQRTPLQAAPVPADPVGRHPDINAKDAHVYAAAIACGARYLLTLDKPLMQQVNQLGGDPFALSPGDFLQQVLPTHPEYVAAPDAGQAGGGGYAGT